MNSPKIPRGVPGRLNRGQQGPGGLAPVEAQGEAPLRQVEVHPIQGRDPGLAQGIDPDQSPGLDQDASHDPPFPPAAWQTSLTPSAPWS